MPIIRKVAPMLIAALLAACGGSDDTMTGPDGDDDRQLLADPSFSDDIQEIIERRGCAASQCHGTGEGGMTLSASANANYEAWVGVDATSEQAFLRVDPGDPDNSYVVIKLEGRQNVGDRMPLGAPPLDDIDLGNIRNWIAAGALQN